MADSDSDTDGISVASAAVLSNPGRIADAIGNVMTATALPDTLNSAQSSHTVDITAPTLTGLAFTASGPYGVGDSITLQATFSEAVTISRGAAVGIPLTIGSNSRSATAAVTATASTTHNFSYTVASGDSDTDGISVSAAAVLSNPGNISDSAGNAMTATALPGHLNQCPEQP